MAVSSANLTVANFQLTPMRVTYKGVDLGGTTGNVSVSIETKLSPIKADQLGDTDLDDVVSGMAIMVSFEIAEVKSMDRWKTVFPFFKQVGTGPTAMYFDSQIGHKASDEAGVLILHPLELPDANLNADYKFYKCTAQAKSELVFGPTDQVKLKVEFKIYPDLSVYPARFLTYGDPTIGLVAATAGAPAFSGTGNGTMTSVVAYSGQTATETITATCVTAVANGGVFNVNGSLSGALGLATVGVNFNSSKISFIINDGATDFIVGDAFTVATTAANYV